MDRKRWGPHTCKKHMQGQSVAACGIYGVYMHSVDACFRQTESGVILCVLLTFRGEPACRREGCIVKRTHYVTLQQEAMTDICVRFSMCVCVAVWTYVIELVKSKQLTNSQDKNRTKLMSTFMPFWLFAHIHWASSYKELILVMK